MLVVAENLYGYGVAGRLSEAMPLSATTRKGAIRARMSHRLFEAHEKGVIRAVSGRAGDFFGPGVRTSSLGDRFWPDLLRGKAVNWFGDPDARHSFTYVPDFVRALIALGAAADSHGRAWHVGSPEVLTPRTIAYRAAALAGASAPKLRRTPKIVLRLVGLAVPAAGEVVEMEYSYAHDFVMAHDDWTATGWDEALTATIGSWGASVPAALAA